MSKMRKRKESRVITACNNCRRRKTRCDGVKPTCGTCLRLGKACVYAEAPDALQRAPKPSRIAALESRVALLESIIQQNSGSASFEDSDAADDDDRSQVSGESVTSTHQRLQQYSLKPRRDTGPIPTFNDRLARIKACVGGESRDCTIYISNAFFSILSPTDIEKLSFRLADPYFSKKLEEVSYEIWKLTNSSLSSFVPSSTDFLPDPALLERSLDIYFSTKYTFKLRLLTITDLDPKVQPELHNSIRDGIHAAALIFGGLSMYFGSDFEQFSEDFVMTQVSSAYFQAIRTLNSIHFSKPSFLQLRVSMLLFWLLRMFSSIPSLLSFMRPMLDMARVLGIDHAISDRSLTKSEAEWRHIVWKIAVDFQYSICANLYLKPLLDYATVEPLGEEFANRPEYEYLRYSWTVNGLYHRARHTFFSLFLQNCDPDKVYEEIISMDRELTEWRNKVPAYIWNLSVNENPNLSVILRQCRAGDLQNKYYHTIIAVHSIGAFNPQFLPKTVPRSLEKITEAGRAIFEFALMLHDRKGLCTNLTNVNITTALCTLLYKQLRYPHDESNDAEILYLQANLSNFKYHTTWPTMNTLVPETKIWEVLMNIISQLQSSNNTELPPVSNFGELLLDQEQFPYENDQCTII